MCLAQVMLLLSCRSQDVNSSSVVLGSTFLPITLYLFSLFCEPHFNHRTRICIILKLQTRFYEGRSTSLGHTETPREVKLLSPNLNTNNGISFIQFQILFSCIQYLPLTMYVGMWLYVDHLLMELHADGATLQVKYTKGSTRVLDFCDVLPPILRIIFAI